MHCPADAPRSRGRCRIPPRKAPEPLKPSSCLTVTLGRRPIKTAHTALGLAKSALTQDPSMVPPHVSKGARSRRLVAPGRGSMHSMCGAWHGILSGQALASYCSSSRVRGGQGVRGHFRGHVVGGDADKRADLVDEAGAFFAFLADMIFVDPGRGGTDRDLKDEVPLGFVLLRSRRWRIPCWCPCRPRRDIPASPACVVLAG